MIDRPSDLDRRSKAFKGKGAGSLAPAMALPVSRIAGDAGIRVLLRSYEYWLEETVTEMQTLALESATAGLDVSLRCVRIALASGATRHRLDWFVRSEPHAVAWPHVKECFNRIPAPLRTYLQQCQIRAKELNALESVFRYAASQLAMYLEHGTVKIRRSDET
ncbi:MULTISPECIES: hypothetical protein [Burkholderia cepacia complex]|uniref:hypothetical protein n=1 Tax=Burkholderia cepacia complex TaxID=87882 RepID=UPI001CF4C53E|nr:MULTISPECIES: hypothetical protein [Burkholderia cepacia complex]MCA8057432.1 hypothetical protein [Burkholderia cepacia]MDN7534619.1 hypothetical protein [Burkholderia orbicola]